VILLLILQKKLYNLNFKKIDGENEEEIKEELISDNDNDSIGKYIAINKYFIIYYEIFHIH